MYERRSYKYRLYPTVEQANKLQELCLRENLRKGRCFLRYRKSDGVFVQGSRLFLPGIPGLKIKLHRKLPGPVTEVTVRRESSGRWYVIFFVLYSIQQSKCLSAGNKLFNDEFLDLKVGRLKKRLEKAERVLARKAKTSRNWSKQLKRAAKLREKLAFIYQDYWHKKTAQLARSEQNEQPAELNSAPRWVRKMWDYKRKQHSKTKGT
ncbi:MAG: helix-turn-helix domain-containing protein [Firmicutes bacterium]|nr:helix-turn-helix domain-containing protein [Bacillota bacterium]HQD39101.1 helix-turn-helix domain-containing protein [Bacillota bacterium]